MESKFGFSSFAETWNGRLAMMGFIIGLGTRAAHRSRDPFPDRNGVMTKERIDVWVPETRLGYFKLFYFGMLMGAICVGGNTALGSLLSAMTIGS